MKDFFKIALVLVITAAGSGALLSIADAVSAKKIAANQQRAVEEGIRIIEPNADKIEEKVKDVYAVSNSRGEKLGYVFLTQGQGYAGPIKLLCGVDSRLSYVLGIEVIESTETPGLGARINEDSFKSQFKGISILNKIGCVKGQASGSDISAITGATISSRSVVNIINSAIEDLKQKLK